MKNVVRKLKQYGKSVDLRERFAYEFNFSNNDIFSAEERSELESTADLFERNVKLKWILKEKYQATRQTSELDFWIINDWGGIRGFKPNDRNILKIERFKKQLLKTRLSKDSFSTISSLSKLSSFMNPENFAIYDSRVIYTLNWLILTCENQDGLNQKYFPIPTGRNRIIADFDINTLINLTHIDDHMNEEPIYVSQQDAYFMFSDFVKETSCIIYGAEAKPFELEMLLFTLADKEIFEELRNKTSVTYR